MSQSVKCYMLSSALQISQTIWPQQRMGDSAETTQRKGEMRTFFFQTGLVSNVTGTILRIKIHQVKKLRPNRPRFPITINKGHFSSRAFLRWRCWHLNVKGTKPHSSSRCCCHDSLFLQVNVQVRNVCGRSEEDRSHSRASKITSPQEQSSVSGK